MIAMADITPNVENQALKKRLGLQGWIIAGVMLAIIVFGMWLLLWLATEPTIKWVWVAVICAVSIYAWQFFFNWVYSLLNYEERKRIAAEPAARLEAPLQVSHTPTGEGAIRFEWTVALQYRGWQIVGVRWAKGVAQTRADAQIAAGASEGKKAQREHEMFETKAENGSFDDEPVPGSYPEYQFWLQRRRPRLWVEQFVPMDEDEFIYKTDPIKIMQYVREQTWTHKADEKIEEVRYREAEHGNVVVQQATEKIVNPPDQPPQLTEEQLRTKRLETHKKFMEEEADLLRRLETGELDEDSYEDELGHLQSRKSNHPLLRRGNQPQKSNLDDSLN